jgi:hypothetical protein
VKSGWSRLLSRSDVAWSRLCVAKLKVVVSLPCSAASTSLRRSLSNLRRFTYAVRNGVRVGTHDRKRQSETPTEVKVLRAIFYGKACLEAVRESADIRQRK